MPGIFLIFLKLPALRPVALLPKSRGPAASHTHYF